jgi:UDP-N-acetylmuramoylalanine--D-glutamate ligase
MTGPVAIFGLGRSGLAIARAAISQGSQATVYDQSAAGDLAKPEILARALELGANLQLGWNGDLPPPETPGQLLVVNPAVDKRHKTLSSAVRLGYEVVSEVEFAYRISKAPIVAVTGTNGKSTTTVMTYLCLRECGIDAILCGNIFGSGYEEAPLSEAALNSNPNQILVAEISSFQLEWVREFKPISAGITNIWPDHLNRYESFEDYSETKQRVFGAQDELDFAVVRANDPVVRIPGRGTGGKIGRRSREGNPDLTHRPRTLTFGATGEHARVDERFITILDKQVRLDELPFSEPHNHSNAQMAGLLAYGALKAMSERHHEQAKAVIGKAIAESSANRAARRNAYNQWQLEAAQPAHVLPGGIIDGLRAFRGLAHRMEFVGEKNGIRLINNSMCTNPDAVLKSATSLRGPNHILIGGQDKDLDFSPLKHYFSSGMHKAYVYGQAREKLSEQIGTKLVYRTMEEALRAALDAARSGEVVMLAPGCASSDQFRDFRERGDVFKQLAKEWLEL